MPGRLRIDAHFVLLFCLQKFEHDGERRALRGGKWTEKVQLRKSRSEAEVAGLFIDRATCRPEYVANLLRVEWNRWDVTLVPINNASYFKDIAAMQISSA